MFHNSIMDKYILSTLILRNLRIAYNVLGIRGFGSTIEQCAALRAAKIWVKEAWERGRSPTDLAD